MSKFFTSPLGRLIIFCCALAAPLFSSTPASAAQNAPGRPGSPRYVTAAVSTTASTVEVSWRPPAGLGHTALGKTTYLAISQPATSRCATITTNCIFSKLTPGVSYTFMVTAHNGAGFSSPSKPVTPLPALAFVSFSANGGIGSMTTEVARLPSPLTDNSFTNPGDNFIGWNTSADGSGVSYSNGSNYSFAASTTLYAMWALPIGTNHPTWSGYADTGATFNSVSGSWVVPTITCAPGSDEVQYTWVGLSGWVWPSDTVEQIGTGSSCNDGQVAYYMWYEMYGDSAVNSGNPIFPDWSKPTYAVTPGDVVTASVVFTNGTFLLTISNTTKGWNFSINIPSGTFSPLLNSAEWIYENPPVVGGSTAAIPDFGSLSFTNCSVTVNGVAGPLQNSGGGYTSSAINLVDATPTSTIGSQILASPAAVNSNGTGFTETWQAGQYPNGCVWTDVSQSCTPPVPAPKSGINNIVIFSAIGPGYQIPDPS